MSGRPRHHRRSRDCDKGLAFAARDRRHHAAWHRAHRRRHAFDFRRLEPRYRAVLPSREPPGVERGIGRVPARTDATRTYRRRRGEWQAAFAPMSCRRRRSRPRRGRGNRLHREHATSSQGRRRNRSPLARSRTSAAARRSSISRTTSPQTISLFPSAKASARSSISSATPRSAWRPIKASSPTSTASRSWRR